MVRRLAFAAAVLVVELLGLAGGAFARSDRAPSPSERQPPAIGQHTPAPTPATSKWPTREGDFVVKDFRFKDGETLPELRLHYTTLGRPRRDAAGRVTNAVMVLHGTGGAGWQFLRPQFADVLYRPGGLLDIAKWYVILPDGIGHGKSSKPSDGLRARFPHYDYDDMVAAQHLLLTQGLHVDHLRLLMGTSMGCMHDFVWAETYPDFASAIMPAACQPVQIAGRNRMWRRALMDAIRLDPEWKDGDYAGEPKAALRTAGVLLLIAGSAPQQMQAADPTRDQADAALEKAVDATIKDTDANDLLYQVDASRNYDPWPGLEKITAPLTWINSADDFINPPEVDIPATAIKRIRNGRFVLIPASMKTHGHGTHTWAADWEGDLAALLARSGPTP